MSGFEDFWAAYPRKVGKFAAQREWQKLSPSADVQKEMAAALEWQVPLWDDPQYIPHPRTWLHQGRWMDEPPAPKVERRAVPRNVEGIASWITRRAAGNE